MSSAVGTGRKHEQEKRQKNENRRTPLPYESLPAFVHRFLQPASSSDYIGSGWQSRQSCVKWESFRLEVDGTRSLLRRYDILAGFQSLERLERVGRLTLVAIYLLLAELVAVDTAWFGYSKREGIGGSHGCPAWCGLYRPLTDRPETLVDQAFESPWIRWSLDLLVDSTGQRKELRQLLRWFKKSEGFAGPESGPPMYHPFLQVGRDYEGTAVSGPELEELDAMFHVRYPERLADLLKREHPEFPH